MYLSVSALSDCQKLQDDLSRLEDWEREWQMEFHPAKCNILRITRKKTKTIFPYTLHGHLLEEVKSAKYLGITIADDMTWSGHINKTVAKANSKLGFLRRNIKVKDADMRVKAYKTIVRPTMEYCSSVWDPHVKQQASSLEMVQRRAARWATSRYHNTSSVNDMLHELRWRSLSQRRVDSQLSIWRTKL